MTPTITELRGWRPDAFTAAAVTLAERASTMSEALTASGRAASVPMWHGAIRGAALTRLGQEIDHAAEVRTLLLTAADLAADAATALSGAADGLLTAVDAAVEAGYTVGDDGEVSHPDPDRSWSATRRSATIRAGLVHAGQLDAHFAARLTTCAADLTAIRTGAPDLILPGGTSIDPDRYIAQLTAASPDRRRELLAPLSPDQIRQLVTADPQAMGNLDGVDFAVRIEANDINIRTALIAEETAGRGDGPRAAQLREMLIPVADPHRGDGSAGPVVPRQFVAFENTDNGRFIELFGTLAPGMPGVGVVIPGTGTDLNGSAGNRRAAAALARSSGAPVLLYVDDDLPQRIAPDLDRLGLDHPWFGIDALWRELPETALSAELAVPMAQGLTAFGRELDREIAAVAPGTPTTYIGHSYGGSVLGTAEQLGLNADRTVYASSAGTGALGTEWRNPNPDVERYSLTAPGDPIHVAQQFGSLVHGGDPDTADGVTRLDTGHYSGDHPDHQGLVSGVDGHGGYWNDPRSTAFENLAAVVRGDEASRYVDRGADLPLVDDRLTLTLQTPWEVMKFVANNARPF